MENPRSVPKNTVGQKIGRLTFIQRVGADSQKRATWRCLCDCGIEIIVPGCRVGRNVSSCGCYRRENTKQRMWKGVGELSQSYWGQVVANATSRNVVLEVTIEQAWDIFVAQNHQCAITSLQLTFSETVKGLKTSGTASLDRIDNARGYAVDNVWWVHKDINIMKKDHSLSYFIELCQLVTKHNSA